MFMSVCVFERERESEVGIPVFLSSNGHAYQEVFAAMTEPY